MKLSVPNIFYKYDHVWKMLGDPLRATKGKAIVTMGKGIVCIVCATPLAFVLCVLQHLFDDNEIVATASTIAFPGNEESIRFENGYHVIKSQVSLCSLSKLH